MTSPESAIYVEHLMSPRTPGEAIYTSGNLALLHLQQKIQAAAEPQKYEINSAKRLFEDAAEANMSSDALLAFRSKMLGAYVSPIIWADLVASSVLTDSQARNAGEKIDLKHAGDELAEASILAMKHLFRTKKRIGDELPTNDQRKRIGKLYGFLNEATVVLLCGRHNTAKVMALPSLQHEDDFQPEIRLHADGFLYDSRKNRPRAERYPYQVKTTPTVYDTYTYDMPIISADDLGNLVRSKDWGRSEGPFETIRQLALEREKPIDPSISSVLDRLSSRIQNKIMRW